MSRSDLTQCSRSPRPPFRPRTLAPSKRQRSKRPRNPSAIKTHVTYGPGRSSTNLRILPPAPRAKPSPRPRNAPGLLPTGWPGSCNRLPRLKPAWKLKLNSVAFTNTRGSLASALPACNAPGPPTTAAPTAVSTATAPRNTWSIVSRKASLPPDRFWVAIMLLASGFGLRGSMMRPSGSCRARFNACRSVSSFPPATWTPLWDYCSPRRVLVVHPGLSQAQSGAYHGSFRSRVSIGESKSQMRVSGCTRPRPGGGSAFRRGAAGG